jgi:secreted trypsin-like serine protease
MNRIIALGLFSLALGACVPDKKAKEEASNLKVGRNFTTENFPDLAYLAKADRPSDVLCSGVFVARKVFLTAASCVPGSESLAVVQGQKVYRNIQVLNDGRPTIRGGIKTSGRDLLIYKVEDHNEVVTTELGTNGSLNRIQSSSEFIEACRGDGDCPYVFAGLGRSRPQGAFEFHWKTLPLRSRFSRTGDELHAGRFAFSVCEGDLGAALYHDTGDKLLLVGIASRYFTPAETNCLESDGAIFTNLTTQSTLAELNRWIQENS